MHKPLGFLLSVGFLLLMATYPAEIPNGAEFVGICILLAGFMTGSDGKE